jgi:regulator of protease activity HflC (stomatin/prohibitin superfamily)|tara:strand:+ start:584 stop:1324 length:741 start_codon:yes stop_codon:yes gene_type:complete
MAWSLNILITLVVLLFFSGIRIVNQYERAVKFRLGKYVGTLQPGFRWIIPVIDRVQKVDVRVITTDIPSQEVMSQDNVPIKVNGVVFFKVLDAAKAVLEVEHYQFAVTQLAQSSLRDMAGKSELDSVLAKRDQIGQKIKEIVDEETDPWGIKVTDVKIKDIELPETMKRAMAAQAESERNRRARIILADAESQASKKLVEAGKVIDQSPAALKLRLYQTLSDIADEKNSTIIFPFPEEMAEFFKRK